ncbi:MAG: hypothetical protein WC052_02020 [Patescibacteria group bacterium]
MVIIPSILTDSSQELISRVQSVAGLGLTVQVDFMDGQFVPTKSVSPDDLPELLRDVEWEAHLMVRDPLSWSPPLYRLGVSRVYWHVEALDGVLRLPRPSSRIEHGLALRLETPVTAIESYVPSLTSLLLLSIEKPGYQGEVFSEAVYEKIRTVKARYPQLKLTIDGGVKIEHMKPLSKLGVDRVAVGSTFWKFGDPKTVLAAFRQATL